jgi:hypothetical protein
MEANDEVPHMRENILQYSCSSQHSGGATVTGPLGTSGERDWRTSGLGLPYPPGIDLPLDPLSVLDRSWNSLGDRSFVKSCALKHTAISTLRRLISILKQGRAVSVKICRRTTCAIRGNVDHATPSSDTKGLPYKSSSK